MLRAGGSRGVYYGIRGRWPKEFCVGAQKCYSMAFKAIPMWVLARSLRTNVSVKGEGVQVCVLRNEGVEGFMTKRPRLGYPKPY